MLINKQFNLAEKRGLLAGMAEWVNLPADPGSRTLADVCTEELEAEGVLVDDVQVVGCCLVGHAPASQHHLQLTCRSHYTFIDTH